MQSSQEWLEYEGIDVEHGHQVQNAEKWCRNYHKNLCHDHNHHGLNGHHYESQYENASTEVLLSSSQQ